MSHNTCFHSKESSDTRYGGGRQGHAHTYTRTRTHAHTHTPAILLIQLTPYSERKTEEKETWFQASLGLTAASFSQCEHLTEMSGILVFKEHFHTVWPIKQANCLSGAQRSSGPFQLCRQDRLCWPQRDRVGFQEGALQRRVFRIILTLHDFCLIHRLKKTVPQ